MSRSRKKTPIHGVAIFRSEKPDKRIWHGRMRAKERGRLVNDPESVTTHKDECGNKYCMGKDGQILDAKSSAPYEEIAMPWFKFALICSLIVGLSGCSQTPYISTSTHRTDHVRQLMRECATVYRDNHRYQRCHARSGHNHLAWYY